MATSDSPAPLPLVEIDRRRRLADVTKAALCRKAGVSQGHYHKLMRGRSSPTVRTLDKLVAALGAFA